LESFRAYLSVTDVSDLCDSMTLERKTFFPFFEEGKLCGFQTICASETLFFFKPHRRNGRVLPVLLIVWYPSVKLRSKICEQLVCGALNCHSYCS